MIIINAIKKIMLIKNIGFNELQEGTKISKSTLSPLVNSSEIPQKTKLDTLERVAVFLGVPLTTFLANEPHSISEVQINDEKSSVSSQEIVCFYEEKELFINLDVQTYEVEKKLDYYLYFNVTIEKTNEYWFIETFRNSSYNDISEFLELLLNYLKLSFERLHSSIILVQLSYIQENGVTISCERSSLYTSPKQLFNLPRLEGNSYITKRG